MKQFFGFVLRLSLLLIISLLATRLIVFILKPLMFLIFEATICIGLLHSFACMILVIVFAEVASEGEEQAPI